MLRLGRRFEIPFQEPTKSTSTGKVAKLSISASLPGVLNAIDTAMQPRHVHKRKQLVATVLKRATHSKSARRRNGGINA